MTAEVEEQVEHDLQDFKPRTGFAKRKNLVSSVEESDVFEIVHAAKMVARSKHSKTLQRTQAVLLPFHFVYHIGYLRGDCVVLKPFRNTARLASSTHSVLAHRYRS